MDSNCFLGADATGWPTAKGGAALLLGAAIAAVCSFTAFRPGLQSVLDGDCLTGGETGLPSPSSAGQLDAFSCASPNAFA